MDKQTISHYGWIVVMLLTLSVILIFATPFGRYIRIATENILIAFMSSDDEVLDNENVNDWQNSFEHEIHDKYSDVEYEKLWYSSLQLAISDANQHITENMDVDKNHAKAAIYVNKNDNSFIVLPIVDCKINEVVNLENSYTLDLNGQTIELTSGANFEFVSGSNITIVDGRTKGKITKTANSDSAETLFNVLDTESNINLTIRNGIYNIEQSGTGWAHIINQKSQNNANIVIKDGQFIATGNKTRNIHSAGNITIENAIINSIANEMSVGLYSQGNTTINNGQFIATSESKNTTGIVHQPTMNNTNLVINDGTFKGISKGPNTTCSGIYINMYSSYNNNNVTINNCNSYALNTGTTLAYSLIVRGSQEDGVVTINDGVYYGFSNHIGIDNSTVIINGGTFSGTHSGIQTLSNITPERIQINGGYFESCNSSIYFGAKETYIKNSTLKVTDFNNLLLYDFFKNEGRFHWQNDSIQGNQETIVGCGSANNDCSIYMDNCTLLGESDFNIITEAEYNEKNITFYLSNLNFDRTIFVQAPNENGYEAKLYIGKNVTAKQFIAYGLIDFTTYQNIEFK